MQIIIVILLIWLLFSLFSGNVYVGSELLPVTLIIHWFSNIFQVLNTLLIIFPVLKKQTFCRSSAGHSIPISFNHLLQFLMHQLSLAQPLQFSYSKGLYIYISILFQESNRHYGLVSNFTCSGFLLLYLVYYLLTPCPFE